MNNWNDPENNFSYFGPYYAVVTFYLYNSAPNPNAYSHKFFE